MKQIKLKIEKCADCMLGAAYKRGMFYCYNPDDNIKGRVISNPDVIDPNCILEDWQGDE